MSLTLLRKGLFDHGQVLDGSGDCAGLLQFVKPVSPTSVVLMKSSQDPGTIDIITPQKRWVVTNDSQSGNSVDLSRGSVRITRAGPLLGSDQCWWNICSLSAAEREEFYRLLQKGYV